MLKEHFHLKMMTGWGQLMAPTIKHRDPLLVDISIREFTGNGIYMFSWEGHLYIKRLQWLGDEQINMLSTTLGIRLKQSGPKTPTSRRACCWCGTLTWCDDMILKKPDQDLKRDLLGIDSDLKWSAVELLRVAERLSLAGNEADAQALLRMRTVSMLMKIG